MIDCSLTDEQWALRELAHDFAAKEIRPVAWEHDRECTWPQAVIKKPWEVGLMNAHIPEHYGGAGASYIDGVLIEEELGWGCSGIGTSISCNGLASAPEECVQFGVPIAMHQAIQFMIADMATKVLVARLATWNSAVLLDQGKRNTLESSHAKRFAADTATEVTTDTVQIYGGYGFIKDYPVEKLMRDAKIMQLYEGTSQIQRLVIARETLLPRPVAALAGAAA
jgi:alkylation response protein AidB-like acyl-CoA dehydrogenase